MAAVPRERLLPLRAADPRRYEWVWAGSWSECVEAIRASPVDLAVVDPLLGGEARAHGIERLRVLFPSLPLLVYTEMTPGTAAVLLQLGRAGIRRVVLHRFEDSPASLRAALRAELEWSATQQIMGALDEFYHGLPAVLREALQAMLHAPIEAATVAALAARAQMTRRTCERWFFKLRLPSPHTAVVLMRMLYAHRLLLDPGYTVDDVAVKMGYGRSKTMQMHLREAFGLTAGELRVSLSAEEGIQLVIGRHFAPLRRAAS